MEDLIINVQIVPRLIPIQSYNFTVKEGLSRDINTDIVNILHPFYSAENPVFAVEEPPQHGEIRYRDGHELSHFTWEEVRRENTNVETSLKYLLSNLPHML